MGCVTLHAVRVLLAMLVVLLAGCGGDGSARQGDSGSSAREGDRAATAPSTPREGERATTTPSEGPAGTPAPPRAAAVDGLTLREQVGQLVVLRFDGTELPAYVADILRSGRAAGVILFRDNLSDPAQGRRLVRAVQRAADGRALIMTDQEGGAVRNLPWVGPERAAPAQGDERAVRTASRAAGRGLREQGVNVTLAPVADVPAAAVSPLGGRGFARDAGTAGRLVAAATAGWQDGGVAATLKHFPGLGAASANTDDAPATASAELAPFRAGIDAGARLVMTSSARYPALDGERVAMTSRRIVTGLLREELGFDGVVITDSLEARAVRAVGSPARVAVDHVDAGGDVALTTGRGSWIRVFRALQRRAQRSPAFRERVRASAARVLALKRSLDLPGPGGGR